MSLLFNFEEIGIHEQVANADYEYLLMMKNPLMRVFLCPFLEITLTQKNILV